MVYAYVNLEAPGHTSLRTGVPQTYLLSMRMFYSTLAHTS